MKVEKKDLEVFFKVVKATECNLREARIRDPFLKNLGAVLDTYYADRKAIYERFCDKNKEGLPDIKEGMFKFKDEVVEEMTKELEILNAEVVEVDILESLKVIIENTSYKPEFGEIEIIDKILCKMS